MKATLSPRLLRNIVRSIALALPLAPALVTACGGQVGGEVGLEGKDGDASTTQSDSGELADAAEDTSTGVDAAFDAPVDARRDGDADARADADAGMDANCSGMCGCYVPANETRRIDVAAYCADGGNAGYCADAGAGSCMTVCPQYIMGGGAFGGSLYLSYCMTVAGDAGESLIDCQYNGPPCGRRPATWNARTSRRPSTRGVRRAAGAYLARCAVLEAVSVEAFEVLADELTVLGAPRRLATRARQAAHDESRHAHTMRVLARRAGARVPRPTYAPRCARTAAEVALENAVEGCVREAYGALLAAWQAQFATDAGVARAMKTIARDEARHASLASAVHAWLEPQLGVAAQAELRSAMTRALVELKDELASRPPEMHDDALGLPSRDRALALASALGDALHLS